jgi:hypothetical protein
VKAALVNCEPSILRRFTRSNIRHPTYKALAELAKAIKTAFLCHYLGGARARLAQPDFTATLEAERSGRSRAIL